MWNKKRKGELCIRAPQSIRRRIIFSSLLISRENIFRSEENELDTHSRASSSCCCCCKSPRQLSLSHVLISDLIKLSFCYSYLTSLSDERAQNISSSSVESRASAQKCEPYNSSETCRSRVSNYKAQVFPSDLISVLRMKQNKKKRVRKRENLCKKQWVNNNEAWKKVEWKMKKQIWIWWFSVAFSRENPTPHQLWESAAHSTW